MSVPERWAMEEGRNNAGQNDRPNDRLDHRLSLLASAIELERFGNAFYMRMSECVKDRNASSILMGLAGDEEQHRRFIEAEIERIGPGTDPSSLVPDHRITDLIPRTLFPAVAGGACLALKDEIEGVEMGIVVEERSIELYSELAKGTEDPRTKELMLDLVRWEGYHKKITRGRPAPS